MGFLSQIGPWEFTLLLAVVLLLFGARRLPELGASFGRAIREFKRSIRGTEQERDDKLLPHDSPDVK
jgi:sec-independent protein translocase protein TatA